jgi:hypothetical protein
MIEKQRSPTPIFLTTISFYPLLHQDGAPPHLALTSRAGLDNHFRCWWAGRRRRTEWPPRKPDPTPVTVCVYGPKKKYADQTQEQFLTGIQNSRYFSAVPLHVFRETSTPCLSHSSNVCEHAVVTLKLDIRLQCTDCTIMQDL